MHVRLSERLLRTGLLSLAFLLALTCKKSPITPSADELLRPVIWVSTFDLAFAAYETGGNPEGQVIKIKNSGQNTLTYTVSDDADWLSVEPSRGSSSDQLVEHSILVNKSGLAAREAVYEATINIVCNEAYNNPQRVYVGLKISTEPPPEIWVSPPEMMFAAEVGKNPTAQTLRVKNTGMGTLVYDLTWDASWLSVSPAGGSSGGEEKSHAVSVESSSLPEGNYSGTIAVSSGAASNNPRSIRVNLEVKAAAPIPTDNQISISCSPSMAGTGTLVSIPISIRGNLQSISTFGLELGFDSNLFQYVGTNKGSLTGSWAMVDGNLSGPGTVMIGGFSGSGSSIPVGSVGTIAVVTLRVTGAGYSDGHRSQVAVNGYTDDVASMTPQPATTIFTYRQ